MRTFHSMTRRDLFKLTAGAASLAAGGALASNFAAAAEQEIVDLTWETYQEDPWVAEYKKNTGVSVKVIRSGSADEMFAQTQTGALEPDLLYIDSGSIKRYVTAGLIEPIDAAKVPNSANFSLGVDWKKLSSVDGKLYGIPYNWGTQPLMYDEDVVGKVDSWAALWDKKFEGKVNLFDDAYLTFPMIALYIGAKDAYNLTDAEFDECRKALKLLRPQIRTFSRGYSDQEALFASGDAVIGYNLNIQEIFNCQAKGKNIKYTFPKEGTPTWIDNAVVTKKGSRDAVYAFINANLTPQWQARFVDFSFNNGVLTADALRGAGLKEDVIKKTNILDQSKPGFWDHLSIFQTPESIDKRLEVWNDFKAGTL